jgi:ATP-dependent RNA helicase DHX36
VVSLNFGPSILQVVIVSGETGCGKTTQLPQFVLEDADANGMQCNIICTQPRRISAVSVAARVASERGEQPGDTVGYAVRLDQKRSQYTRLLYCTTGVLLRMMVGAPVCPLQKTFVFILQKTLFLL